MILRLCIFVLLIYNLIYGINAVTHWVVTENGRVESYLESPFNIRRPYDLLVLLDQETRLNSINTKYQDLLDRKNNIDNKLSKVKDIPHIGTRLDDYDCLTKGTAVSDIDFYSNIATNGSSWKGIKINLTHNEKPLSKFQEPECDKFSKLESGSLDYDNLFSVKNIENITLAPELSLQKLMPMKSVELFGHEIAQALSKNSSSWLHYNLASLYWRIKGVGPKAVECSRRALHFVSEYYRDIPLHTLAGGLHQARYSSDAATLLLEAVELSPDQPSHYLALGNIYAALAEYNTSITYYDKFLELQPDQDVIASKHAAMCFWKIENGLWKLGNEVIEIQKFFQGILADLHDYHNQQKEWLLLQERLLWEQASFEIQMPGFNAQGVGLLLKSLNKNCIEKMTKNPNKFISCDIDNDMLDFGSFDLQGLFSLIESENEYLDKQQMIRKNHKYSNFVENKSKWQQMKAPDEHILESIPEQDIPPSLTSGNLYFDEPNWPSRGDCLKWNLPVQEKEELVLPVFLPPENKGYQIRSILSKLIDIPEGSEHKLPWYPPSCEELSTGESLLSSFDKSNSATDVKQSSYLRNHLLMYVNDGKADEAEIGQRIITAMKQKVAPTWLLATLASLYWRVRGNQKRALNCLDVALKNIQQHEPREVVFVSVGSIVHHLGFVEEALKYATNAYQLNDVEPSTNFLLALLHYKKNKPLMATYYLKNVLRVNAGYYNGQAELLLKTWSCRMKLGAYPEVSNDHHKVSDKICSEKGAFNGEGVVCSANGEHCKTASIQCIRTDTVPSDGMEINVDRITANCGKQKDPSGSFLSLLSEDITEPMVNPSNIPHQAFHMRISLGENHASTVSVALTEDPVPEALLQLYEKSGTLLLSPWRCKDIRDAEWVYFTSMWQSIATRNVDIGPLLRPLSKPIKDDMKPYCSRSISSSSSTMNHLTKTVLKNRLPNSPEKDLLEWLALMAGDHKASIKELGAKIAIALKENVASWILANAAALYWRIVGNTEESVVCLRQALTYVPNNMRDVPLISLANVLNRVGLHTDALEAAYSALNSHPNYVFNHFTAGNIHTALGDFEKAISFYRSSLALDANFAPARNRLLAISCTLLYDETGTLRDAGEIPDD